MSFCYVAARQNYSAGGPAHVCFPPIPATDELVSAFDPKQTLAGCLLALLELLSDRLEHVSLGAELNKARVH